VLQVYPALTRRRELALRLTNLAAADTQDALGSLDPTVVHGLLDGLAGSVALTLPIAMRLVEAAARDSRPDVRHGADLLDASLAQLASVLDRKFLGHGGSTGEILTACRADHA
jgi:hypothetical protein